MSAEEEKITNFFREYMAEELGNRQIKRAKKQLIRDYFTERPSLIFHPLFIAPALSFAVLVCFLIFQLGKPIVKPAAEPLKIVMVEKKVQEILPYDPSALEVGVRGVSSEVGATMVYQKFVRNIPITIIWVFPGGGEQ